VPKLAAQTGRYAYAKQCMYDPVNFCSGDNTERTSREHGYGRRSEALGRQTQISAARRGSEDG